MSDKMVFQKRVFSRKLLPIAALCILCAQLLIPFRASAAVDYNKEAQERKSLPIQSNSISEWPQGPQIGAEGAILIDADNGTVLYSKNVDEKLYPASTTKMLTCLIAVESCDLNDMISFSQNAVSSVPSGGSNIGIDAGESLPLEQCLYGIMVGSANEVANAVAEHIAGSIPEFAKLMNAKAKELGCTNSNFVNANGLFDENHYTTAHDLAVIATAFFRNELLCKISNMPTYHFTATSTQPDDFYLHNKHELINGDLTYDGIVGGKTGYTDEARQTLVTCCERNGLKLICVILKEESPAQFTDTETLFDYGFNNFQTFNIAALDTGLIPDSSSFFDANNSIFGNSDDILAVDERSSIIIPKNASIDDTVKSVSYDCTNYSDQTIAVISYSFNGTNVGNAAIELLPHDSSNDDNSVSASATSYITSESDETDSRPIVSRTIYVNVISLIFMVVTLTCLFIVITFIYSYTTSYRFSGNRKDRRRYLRRKRETRHGRFHFK